VTARSVAIDSGLAEIACEEGCPLVFVNSKGDDWAADDVNAYTAIISQYSDSSTNVYTNGKTADGLYAGTTGRIYLYAEGSGADFVAENLAKEVSTSVTYGDGFTMSFDRTATAISLFNPTVVPSGEYENYDIPMVVVNGVEGTDTAVAALNPSYQHYQLLTSATTDGFDSEIVESTYHNLTGTLRRQNGIILEIPDYDALGISETTKYKTVDNQEIEYIEYIPSEISPASESAGSIPLVMTFHGGGNTAEYQAWASEWPLIAKQYGFMVVAVNNHVAYDATTMVHFLEQLEAEYPCIDTTRVYASGFSMGSVNHGH